MTRNRGLARLLALLCSLALLAAACSSGDSASGGEDTTTGDTASSDAGDDQPSGAAEPADGESSDGGLTLTVALDSDYAPTTYDPTNFALEQFPFHSLLYDTLFITNSEGDVVPNIVTEFETAEDFTSLTFSIREDVVFDDGTPLDAELVKANLDRRLTEELQAYGLFDEGQESEISSVEVIGPFEVTINWGFEDGLENGHEIMADNVGTMVGPNGVADFASLEAAPEGSGPYVLDLDATTKGASYVMRKKADHWNADAYAYDTVVFNILTDDQARANSVLSGEADLAINVQPAQVEQLEAAGALAKVGGTVGSVNILDKLGITNPAFAFTETRLALSLAIDREQLVALRPGATATAGYYAEGAVGYDPTITERYAFDPEAGRELLASVGLEDGFEIDKVVLGPPTDIELALQQMWQENLGVTLNFPAAANTGEMFDSVRTTPLIINEWNPSTGFVAGPVTSGFMNYQEAENEAISAALGPALGGDPDAAVALNNALVDEGWWIGLYETFKYAGFNADTIQGVPFGGITGIVVLSDVEPA